MRNHPDIQTIVDDFIAQLTAVIQEKALAAVQGALGAGTTGMGTRRAAPSTRANALSKSIRPKGAKRSSEELEQLTSELARYVRAHPGQRIEQIAVGMSTSTKELALPARKLIGESVLKTKRHRRSTQYFAS